MSYDEVNQALMGGGGRSASFKEHKDQVWGVITNSSMRQQTDFTTGEPKVWDDGSPRMQIVISLQTDERVDDEDDGTRNVYVKIPSQMMRAMRDAIKKAGAEGISNGGKFLVRYVGDAEPKKRGMSGEKQYFVKYEAPPSGYMAMPEDDGNVPPPSDEELPF
jgi:hypothetical protein